MFNVSEKYIQAAHSTSRETELRGRIVLTNGSIVPFTSKDLLQGSTSYSNRCLSENTFTLGACYIGEFKTTIKTAIDRYALHGGTIVVEFLLKVDSGEWESVPIGTFTITSAKRVGQYVEIDSFDNMQGLERSVAVGTSGTPADLLTWICQECKVNSGMTEDMWAALVNVEQVFAFSDGDYSTYRDILSDIATMVGGFATVDQWGGIIIKPFGITPVDTVDDRIRTESKFEDYYCKYSGISVKIKGVQYSAISETQTEGLVVILYDNKIAGANSPDQIEAALTNIVESISGIQYVPCEVTMMVNPAYELGDVVSFTGYNTDGTTVISQIHSISWTFRSSMVLSGIGENSKIVNAKTATDKVADVAGSIASQVELKTLTFTNAEKYSLTQGRRVKILDASFSATYNENAVPLMTGQFVANVEEPAVYRIIYELNGVEADFKPEEAVYTTGSKIFTFVKSFTGLSAEVANRLRIYFESSPLTITTHELYQNPLTTEYSLKEVETTYNGKATIEPGNLNAILQSTNLSFAIKWDGNFEVYDDVRPIELDKNYEFVGTSATGIITLIDDHKYEIHDATRVMNANQMTVAVHNAPCSVIMDYDAIPIFDLPYKELVNGQSISGNLGSESVVINPETKISGYCAPYYMQLPDGEKTRISVTSDSSVQLYLIDALTDEIQNVALVGENNTLNYTSNGARFWILVMSAGRAENGNYTITTQREV